MPHVSGFELAENARALRPDLPIVLITGYLQTQERRKAESMNLQAVLEKPNSAETLANALASVLAATAVVPSNAGD
jgi:CheY-like chemotaxis protein